MSQGYLQPQEFSASSWRKHLPLCSLFIALSLLFKTWYDSENIYWWTFQFCWVLARSIVLNSIAVNAQLRRPDFSQIWVLEFLLDLTSTHKWFLPMNGKMLLTLSMVTLPWSHWPAVEDRPDTSSIQKFYFCVQFCLLFVPHSTFQFADAPSARNWKEENLSFEIALALVHITVEPLTRGDEIVSAAINK